jgi:predicted phosphate transport protein (TIGR00153 family)
MLLKSRKEGALYDLLERQANVAVRSSEAFLELARDFANISVHTKRLEELEHEGDTATHELQNSVAATFITPLDKEDLRELSSALDDITDLIEAAAARAELYGLKTARPDLEHHAQLLVGLTKLTEEAVRSLRNGFRRSKALHETLMKIHTVENECDRAFRLALKTLFEEPGIDALTVIKWKELYDRIETASDKCEDVAAIVGTIIVKYA